MYVCIRFHDYLCTHFPEDKMKSSRTGRGQLFEAEVEDEDESSRPRPRTKFWPRGQLGLEDLTSLLSPSTTIHGNLRIQSTCSKVFFHNLSPSFLWSTSWPATLHFILHTFLHPIIVFFSQHMPIPSQPVPL